MKLRFLLLLLFTGYLGSSTLNAQDVSTSVYYKNGEVANGFVEDRNYLKYTERISFTIDKKNKTQLNFEDIDYIDIESKGRYEVHPVEYAQGVESRLLYVKISGPIKLLYGNEKIYASKNDKIHELKESKVNGKKDRQYQATLGQLIKGDQIAVAGMQVVELNKSSLEEFIWDYNQRNRVGESIKIYTPNSPSLMHFMVGGAKRFDNTFDEALIALSGTNFQSHMVSAEVSFFDSDYSDVLYLTSGLWFSINTYEIAGFRQEREVITSQTFTTPGGTVTTMDTMTVVDVSEEYSYSSTDFEIPVYLEFYNISNLVSYYAAVGGSLKLSKEERKFEISDDISKSGLSAALLLELGVALNISKKAMLSLTYNLDTQVNIRGRVRF